ncbi:unnamed protein product, partial [Soboliphyme baturini]|uniref:1-alkyl-2-acetylglycerophosphocholine esterase n=1 Tax=Soboliphyme baturini TaxID=241478 RepID=A0A183IY90_9BILA
NHAKHQEKIFFNIITYFKEDPYQFPYWIPRSEYLDGYAKFAGMSSSRFRDVKIPVLWHAPLLQRQQTENERRFPLIVFSHGLGGNRTTYSTVCYDLASHGFIVAVLEHRNLIILVFAFKNKSLISKTASCRMSERIEGIAEDRDGVPVNLLLGDDFDLLQFKVTIDSFDFDRTAIIGHSFGGATVIGALAESEAFKVGVVLDGWMFPLSADVYSRVPQPILFLNSDSFQWKDNIDCMRQLYSSDVERTMGSVHQSHSDFTFLVNQWIGRRLNIRGTIEPMLCAEISGRLSISFLSTHLSTFRHFCDYDFDQSSDFYLE